MTSLPEGRLRTMWQRWVVNSHLTMPLLIAVYQPTFSYHVAWPPQQVSEQRIESEVAQSCLALCDPMDYSPPGSSVDGILQARILEWVAMPSSRGSSRPKD